MKTEETNDVIITEFSNITKEGIVLHLNKVTTLKTGQLSSKEFYVSWDKIGESIFDNYAHLDSVDEYRKLRLESSQSSQEEPTEGLREELLFNALSEFVFKTFPDASSNDHLKKLKIEADEAMQDNRDSSEYADCLMAVYGAAAKAGFSFNELLRAGFKKLEINKTRKWERLSDGTYQHI
jgi:hypothetical protein